MARSKNSITMQHFGPRATRIINNSLVTGIDYFATEFFIVPGGRYVVGSSRDEIFILDLGYTSSADCNLISSVGVEGIKTCIVVVRPP